MDMSIAIGCGNLHSGIFVITKSSSTKFRCLEVLELVQLELLVSGIVVSASDTW